MDYRSLEHKIRDVMIAEMEARNTAIRKKVANVGRPGDNVKDDTSKLAKQSEIKTKIIDEASLEEAFYSVHPHDEGGKPRAIGSPTKFQGSAVSKTIDHTKAGHHVTIHTRDHVGTIDSVTIKPGEKAKEKIAGLKMQREHIELIDEASDKDTDGAFMKDKDKGAKDSKKKPDAQDEDDPREIKGGKTEVELKPTTNDSTEDSTKEDETSKKARNKVNNEIGAKKTVKENNMSKFNFGLPESLINTVREVVEAKKIEEKLVGGQKKIDANHNGKIDAQDFKLLKGKKKVEEEVEELDEISKELAGRYVAKAAGDMHKQNAKRMDMQSKKHKAGDSMHAVKKAGPDYDYGETDSEHGERVSRIAKRRDTAEKGERAADKKVRNRQQGIWNAGKRLAKEEVEFSANELARLEELAKSL